MLFKSKKCKSLVALSCVTLLTTANLHPALMLTVQAENTVSTQNTEVGIYGEKLNIQKDIEFARYLNALKRRLYEEYGVRLSKTHVDYEISKNALALSNSNKGLTRLWSTSTIAYPNVLTPDEALTSGNPHVPISGLTKGATALEQLLTLLKHTNYETETGVSSLHTALRTNKLGFIHGQDSSAFFGNPDGLTGSSMESAVASLKLLEDVEDFRKFIGEPVSDDEPMVLNAEGATGHLPKETKPVPIKEGEVNGDASYPVTDEVRANLANLQESNGNGQAKGKVDTSKISDPVLRKAVEWGLAQVGKGYPYGMGAKGPHSFDCSGFVMTALAEASEMYRPYITQLNTVGMIQASNALDQNGDLFEEVPLEDAPAGAIIVSGGLSGHNAAGHVWFLLEDYSDSALCLDSNPVMGIADSLTIAINKQHASQPWVALVPKGAKVTKSSNKDGSDGSKKTKTTENSCPIVTESEEETKEDDKTKSSEDKKDKESNSKDEDKENGQANASGQASASKVGAKELTNAGITFPLEWGESVLKYAPPAEVLPSGPIVQAFVETNWGTQGLGKVKEDHNLGGMSWFYDGVGPIKSPRTDVEIRRGSARPADETAYYIQYKNYDDYWNDKIHLVGGPSYGIKGKKTFDEYVKGLFREGGAEGDYAAAGYAAYLPNMKAIYNDINSQNDNYLVELEKAYNGGSLDTSSTTKKKSSSKKNTSGCYAPSNWTPDESAIPNMPGYREFLGEGDMASGMESFVKLLVTKEDLERDFKEGSDSAISIAKWKEERETSKETDTITKLRRAFSGAGLALVIGSAIFSVVYILDRLNPVNFSLIRLLTKGKIRVIGSNYNLEQEGSIKGVRYLTDLSVLGWTGLFALTGALFLAGTAFGIFDWLATHIPDFLTKFWSLFR